METTWGDGVVDQDHDVVPREGPGPTVAARCTRGTWGFSATDFCLAASLCDVGPSDEGGVSLDAGGD